MSSETAQNLPEIALIIVALGWTMAAFLVWITLAALAGEHIFTVDLASLSSSRLCIVGMEVSLFRQFEDALVGETHQHPVRSRRPCSMSRETRRSHL